jgi:hypothetical protein
MFLGFIAAIAVICVSVISCSNGIGINIDGVDNEALEYSPSADVAALLEKTSVRLFDGVTTEDLGIDLEQNLSKLRNELSNKFARSVQATDVLSLSTEDIVSLISAEINNIDMPELLEPQAEDIDLISYDFPGLTEEEIVTELSTIRRIYQDQIGALALNTLVDTLDVEVLDANSARSVSYEDGKFSYDEHSATIYEIAVMLLHPLSALTIKDQEAKAYELTAQYMGAATVTADNKLDSFRHAILNVVMANMGAGLRAEKIKWARDFTTAHEAGLNNNGVPSEMDLHNNNVGLRYYQDNSSKKYTKILFIKIETGTNQPTYEAASEAIKAKAIAGTYVDKNRTDAINTIKGINADALVYITPDNVAY